MKKIIIKDDFAFIYLNKNFYKKELIINTFKTYEEFFTATITKLGKYYIIKIQKINNDYELDILANEFLNFILSEEYQNKKKNSNQN